MASPDTEKPIRTPVTDPPGVPRFVRLNGELGNGVQVWPGAGVAAQAAEVKLPCAMFSRSKRAPGNDPAAGNTIQPISVMAVSKLPPVGCNVELRLLMLPEAPDAKVEKEPVVGGLTLNRFGTAKIFVHVISVRVTEA